MLTTRQKIALARGAQAPLLALRRFVGRGPEVQVRRRGVNWQLDLREGIDFSIFLLGAFEPATVAAYERLVGPGMTVIDIGANAGAHTLHLARLVGPEGRVLAFEPTRWALDKLTVNIARNPNLADRITVLQTMLAESEDDQVPAELASSWPLKPEGDVHPLLRARSMSTEGARARPLDAVLADRGVDRVDFVKLDVDGYECQVLGGMLETLRRFRPPLLMEFSPYGFADTGGSLERLVALLDDVGYRLFRLGESAPLPMQVERLRTLIPDGASINVIARPESDA